MSAFCRLQQMLGGDPYVGRKPLDIFHEAALENIRLSYGPEIRTETDPEDYGAWVEKGLRILAGAQAGMVGRGLVGPVLLTRVLDTMRRRVEKPSGLLSSTGTA